MKLPVVNDARYHGAVIFDLDGVLTDTAAIHANAWASMFDDFLASRPEREGEAPKLVRFIGSHSSTHLRTTSAQHRPKT